MLKSNINAIKWNILKLEYKTLLIDTEREIY
jgi:hypothetical protein